MAVLRISGCHQLNERSLYVGRISTFLDIYIEKDIAAGILTEKEAQELIDHMVMKFRMVKFARIASTTSCSPDPAGQLWKQQVWLNFDAPW